MRLNGYCTDSWRDAVDCHTFSGCFGFFADFCCLLLETAGDDYDDMNLRRLS